MLLRLGVLQSNVFSKNPRLGPTMEVGGFLQISLVICFVFVKSSKSNAGCDRYDLPVVPLIFVARIRQINIDVSSAIRSLDYWHNHPIPDSTRFF